MNFLKARLKELLDANPASFAIASKVKLLRYSLLIFFVIYSILYLFKKLRFPNEIIENTEMKEINNYELTSYINLLQELTNTNNLNAIEILNKKT